MTISWLCSERAGLASVNVYDIAGKVVRCLASGAAPAGEHTAVFDGHDNRGRLIPIGVYIVRLETDDRLLSKKVIMSR